MASETDPALRIDGMINAPTALAIITMILAGVGAVAAASATATDAQRRVSVLEKEYQDVPSRLSSIEAYQKSQSDSLRRVETKLDSVIR